MPSRPQQSRPNYSRQRSNSVPTLNFANVTAEEAGLLFSTAERAAARRKRPMSMDSPGPAVNFSYDPVSLPGRTFNFSMPTRYDIGSSPLNHVERASSVKSLPPPPEPEVIEEVNSTPRPVRTAPTRAPPPPPVLVRPATSSSILTSPLSPRRTVDNPALKAYADGLLNFTKLRLDSAAPQTLKTLGLKREHSRPPTPELQEPYEYKPQRPQLRSQFSDWSTTTASTYDDFPSAAPSEPCTPDDCGLMTPDSFFAEVTPRVAHNAQWAAMSSARPSSGVADSLWGQDYYTNTAVTQRPRADSVTSTEAFSYFTGFDSVTAATEVNFSSPSDARHSSPFSSRPPPPKWNATARRSQPSSVASNSVPMSGPRTPCSDILSLHRTPSLQAAAMV